MDTINRSSTEYFSKYGKPVISVRAPGRINLIGEHTDYNNGFVLPAAIQQSVYIHAGFSNDDTCRLFASDLDTDYHFKLRDFYPVGGWADYIMGVLREFQAKFATERGFNMVISGDIPQGAGLSSSAALECAALLAISKLYEKNLQPLEMARMALNAERSFVGLECGIMDQYASIFGKRNHVLLIDCMNETHRDVPLDLGDHSLVLCNSHVVHELAGSAYNERRQQCGEGVTVIRKEYPHVTSLREVSLDMLSALRNTMKPVIFDRCAYVIRENNRVLDVVDKLEAGDLTGIGKLLYEAHDDMRENYEVTCPETDYLVELAHSSGVVLGARQMGGGFGGCTLNLILKNDVDAFREAVTAPYLERYGKMPTLIETETSNGAGIL